MKHKQHIIGYHDKIVGECISRKEIITVGDGSYLFLPSSKYKTYSANDLREIATYMDNAEYNDEKRGN